MREFLDAILDFINAESLTDEEFDGTGLSGSETYSREVYLALRAVIEGREGVSNYAERLKYYFEARGLDLGDTPAKTPTSNIFIGTKL